jgi:MFS family permease
MLMIPWLFFALPAGALADRVDRRRAMVGGNAFRAALLVALALTAATGVGSIWALYAVAFGIGIAETVYDTSAQSIIPMMVPRDRLSRANARLFAAELTANEFVGPPLAGFLVAASVALALVTPAALWVVAVGVLLLVPGRFRVERSHTTIRRDIAEGLGFLWRHGLLRTLAIMVGVNNFATNGTLAILVLYAVGPGSAMGMSEPAFGLMLSAIAAGSLLGFFVVEPIERWLGRARSLLLAILGGALAVGAPALTTSPFLVGAAFLIGGVTFAIWNVVTVSLRQRVTPDRLLGRVNSGYRLLAWGTRPLGAAAGGLLAQALGLRPVFAIMALLTLTTVVGMFRVTDRSIDSAEREVE